MVTRPNQILTMLSGVPVRGRGYAVLDLETDGPMQQLVYPGAYLANYVDKEQDAWFVQRYIEQLDAVKEAILEPFKRMLHHRAPVDIVLSCSCDDDFICHRHLLKRWLAEHLPDTVTGGELCNETILVDTPTRRMIQLIPTVANWVDFIEEVKFLIGCQCLVSTVEQAAYVERLMRYHEIGPIVNISGQPIGTELETIVLEPNDHTIGKIRELLWEPQRVWLPRKESNSEIDALYRSARKTV